jgi:alpha-1,3-rhamnosyltransferase
MPENQQSRFSVVVPSYNHAPFVERCLRSIINQTSKPKELIVIDDGSRDGSPQLIEKTLADCPFPAEFFVNDSNIGLCSTLNTGLDKTSGKYFAYLGSDDAWLPQFIEERERILDPKPDAVLAYGHAYLIDENDKIIESTEDWNSFGASYGDARVLLYAGTAPVSPTVAYRRSVLEKHAWNTDAKLEDYELYLQLLEQGEFLFDPQVLSAWRLHDANTSRNLDFMLSECLSAQERVGTKLEWPRSKLQAIQRNTRFFFGEEYERKGDRGKATALILGNLRGAASAKVMARALARLVLPHKLLAGRRVSRRAAIGNKHGTLKF